MTEKDYNLPENNAIALFGLSLPMYIARVASARLHHQIRESVWMQISIDSSIIKWYYRLVDKKHLKTLEAVFEKPTRSTILWRDIEGLFIALGAEVTEGKGSRVRVELKGVRAVFHRPHPEKETDKGAVKSVQRFLIEAGVINDGI